MGKGDEAVKIKMELLSDVVFGNGMSVPGAEDISILCDMNGFPYYKGGTFKGVFREELMRYLEWTENDENKRKETMSKILGRSGDDDILNTRKAVFSDFVLSDYVKQQVIEEIGNNSEIIQDCFTNLRTFTEIEDTGIVKEGSLRMLRCVNKDLCFYSEIFCADEDVQLVKEVLSLIKWIGTMRNRGFGKIKISVIEEGK